MSLDARKPWANGVKRGDQNDTRLLNIACGRWMLIAARMYVGDSYGYVGSDGWTLRVTLVRNPKAAAASAAAYEHASERRRILRYAYGFKSDDRLEGQS